MKADARLTATAGIGGLSRWAGPVANAVAASSNGGFQGRLVATRGVRLGYQRPGAVLMREERDR
jgi:hypothetical protein